MNYTERMIKEDPAAALTTLNRMVERLGHYITHRPQHINGLCWWLTDADTYGHGWVGDALKTGLSNFDATEFLGYLRGGTGQTPYRHQAAIALRHYFRAVIARIERETYPVVVTEEYGTWSRTYTGRLPIYAAPYGGPGAAL